MFSTQYIDEFFLEQLRILEKTINRHDVDALVLGIDESKNFEEKIEVENACSYEDLPPTPNKTGEERLIVANQFSEFWSKYFIKKNVVTTSSGTATKNQYYYPDFVTKLKSCYLPTVPLWTKLMDEKIKNKNEHLKLTDLPIRTIYTETNTNAQVEECFKIKKHSSNINQNINLQNINSLK